MSHPTNATTTIFSAIGPLQPDGDTLGLDLVVRDKSCKAKTGHTTVTIPHQEGKSPVDAVPVRGRHDMTQFFRRLHDGYERDERVSQLIHPPKPESRRDVNGPCFVIKLPPSLSFRLRW